ncbi:hypothetical protein G6F22_012643 [Rhizopus arrhizus]|nr:hypothetical protein G6F22_012643 [Rhizopus arrhizus]
MRSPSSSDAVLEHRREIGRADGRGLAFLRDLVHQADALGFIGLHRPAGQDEFERAPFAHQPGQALRPAVAGNEAQLDLGQAHAGCGRGDAEGAGQRQLQAAAEGIAVDHGNRGDAQLADALEHFLAQAGAFMLVAQRASHQLRDVGPGAEGLGAGACDDQSARCRGRHAFDGQVQVPQLFEAERVQRLLPVQGQHGDAAPQG